MLPTPDTSHIPPSVYPPSEDSYLLLDVLSSTHESAFLTARFPHTTTPPPLLLEPGSGSGVLTAFLAAHARQLLGRPDVLALAADANPCACGATRATVERAGAAAAGVFLGAVRADLAAAVRPRVVDVLVFNPPYVPTEGVPGFGPREGVEEGGLEREARMLELACAGGADGMVVAGRMLEGLDGVLSERGVA
ncbi:hypothetical protein FGG08_005416, partial [Glutinoglossum americanum]